MSEREDLRRAYASTQTAEGYDAERFASAWGAIVHETQVRVINQVIRTHGVKRVLEIAPGPARLSREVIGFDRGVLCDANAAMLAVARRRLGRANGEGQRRAGDGSWQMVQADAFHLPLASGFDLVYTFRFLRHFQKPDRQVLYKQVKALLKPGGLLLFDAVNAEVSLPLRGGEGAEKYPIYDELYDRETLVQEVTSHGFVILSLTDVIRHVKAQRLAQIYVGPRSHRLAKWLIRALERLPGRPLEWVLLCQRS